jgi:hypothetical protein
MRTHIPRSESMILVGYFLARCGVGEDHTLPPAALGTTSWEKAYSMFYDRIGGGREPSTFQRSLQNVRDAFDAYVDNGRRGWYKDGKPAPLPWSHQKIFDRWRLQDNQALWKVVQSYIGGVMPKR